MEINNIRDGRVQKSTIKIEFKMVGYWPNIDAYVDNIACDLKTIIEQREQPEGLKIKITLK